MFWAAAAPANSASSMALRLISFDGSCHVQGFSNSPAPLVDGHWWRHRAGSGTGLFGHHLARLPGRGRRQCAHPIRPHRQPSRPRSRRPAGAQRAVHRHPGAGRPGAVHPRRPYPDRGTDPDLSQLPGRRPEPVLALRRPAQRGVFPGHRRAPRSRHRRRTAGTGTKLFRRAPDPAHGGRRWPRPLPVSGPGQAQPGRAAAQHDFSAQPAPLVPPVHGARRHQRHRALPVCLHRQARHHHFGAAAQPLRRAGQRHQPERLAGFRRAADAAAQWRHRRARRQRPAARLPGPGHALCCLAAGAHGGARRLARARAGPAAAPAAAGCRQRATPEHPGRALRAHLAPDPGRGRRAAARGGARTPE